jgi:hypothetical protein
MRLGLKTKCIVRHAPAAVAPRLETATFTAVGAGRPVRFQAGHFEDAWFDALASHRVRSVSAIARLFFPPYRKRGCHEVLS